MNQVSATERKIFQLLVVALALICFVPGGISAFGGLNGSAVLSGSAMIFSADSPLRGFGDNQYRFAFGVFFTQGLVLLYFLRNIEKNKALFYFAALSLFIGGLGRLTNILEFGLVDEQVLPPTIIELAIVPLLVVWYRRVALQN
ncbi:DUF4345 domain-containing protein [Microbulbifer sp. SSSA002]|uniref:DUF4345 domain-containing protein n=1 Tax=Microbulbifer sp. SSSA002 TaxID=3243376 RepID=UPI00403A13A4